MADKKGRSTKVISFTGTTGTGKSWQAREVAKKFAGTNQKVLVLTYTGSGASWDNCKEIKPIPKNLRWRKGWRKIHVAAWEGDKEVKTFRNIFKYCRDCVIIFDDCRMYFGGNWENTDGLKQIFNDHRHNGLDLMMIAHAPNHIPKQTWGYVGYAFIFYCSLKIKEQEVNCQEPLKFLAAQEKVNKRFKAKSNEAKEKVVGIYEYRSLLF